MMKDFKVLKVLDLFKGAFEKIGIDYVVMRKILQIKFIMDGRRVPTVMGNSSTKKKENEKTDENNFLKSLWPYALTGGFIVPVLLKGTNYIFEMTVFFGIVMFMVMTSLVSDFSSVLLDLRDKNIIFSRPVDHKTLSTAKTIHVFVYMFFITIALCGIPLIATLIQYDSWFFLLFLFEVIFMDLFIVVLTALVYLFILRFFDGEKLKDVINYVQIALSLMITVGYQLMGRLFTFIHLNALFTPKWWQYFIIPIWFGAPFELLLHGNHTTDIIVFSILALLVPIAAIFIYVKLMPSFETHLQKLSNNTGKSRKKTKKIFQWFSKIICRDKMELLFFRFTSDMIKNEREFKLKVYPSIGFAMIFPFIFIFNMATDLGWSDLILSKSYLNIYFCAVMLPSVVMMIRYSSCYKGAWIYKIMPTLDLSPIFKGSLKSMLVQLLLPIYSVECILFLIIFGLRIFPDLILVFLNMLFYMVLSFKTTKAAYPFSESFGTTDNKGKGFILFLLMALLGILSLVHYAATFITFGVYLYSIVMIVVDYFV